MRIFAHCASREKGYRLVPVFEVKKEIPDKNKIGFFFLRIPTLDVFLGQVLRSTFGGPITYKGAL